MAPSACPRCVPSTDGSQRRARDTIPHACEHGQGVLIRGGYEQEDKTRLGLVAPVVDDKDAGVEVTSDDVARYGLVAPQGSRQRAVVNVTEDDVANYGLKINKVTLIFCVTLKDLEHFRDPSTGQGSARAHGPSAGTCAARAERAGSSAC